MPPRPPARPAGPPGRPRGGRPPPPPRPSPKAEGRGRSGGAGGGAGGGPAPAAPEAVTKGGGPVPFRPGRAMLGAYLGLEGRSLTESLALRRRQLGRDERIVHVFYDFTDTLPKAIEGLPAA